MRAMALTFVEIMTFARICLPPLRAGEGGGGVRAQRAARAKCRSNVYLAHAAADMACLPAFGGALKPRQPHTNPPLLLQGREQASQA